MKRSLVVNSIAFFFVFLFLYTGAAKLMDIQSFKDEIATSPILGKPFASIIAWTLPACEILIGIALFVPPWRSKGLYASCILMTLFAGYIAAILLIDKHIACSCGGIIENLSLPQHLVFNIACIILSIVGFVAARRIHATFRSNLTFATIALALFLFVGWTLFTALTAPAIIKTGLEGRLLPSFRILLPDSVTNLNTDSIATGNPLVFIGFSPFCKHCQHETETIISDIDQFKGVHFYFVTSYPFEQMRTFYNYYKLRKYPNITVGQDVNDYFLSQVKASGVPYTVVYDSKKRLKQVITRFSLDDLSKALLE